MQPLACYLALTHTHTHARTRPLEIVILLHGTMSHLITSFFLGNSETGQEGNILSQVNAKLGSSHRSGLPS
jgi:hypothetical protein